MSQGEIKDRNLGSIMAFKWLSKTEDRWLAYVHKNLSNLRYICVLALLTIVHEIMYNSAPPPFPPCAKY